MACTSSSSGTSVETSIAPTTSATASASNDMSARALEAATRAYSEAYLGGDERTASDLLSARCKTRIADFGGLVASAHELYGDARYLSFKVDQLSGSLARVTYTFDNHDLDQKQEPWVYENGGWKDDDC